MRLSGLGLATQTSISTVWSGASQQVQGTGRQVDAGQDTGIGRCVQVGRCEHREVWAQGRGTQPQVGCKYEHKNKVKKKKPLTGLIAQADRQGWL